MTALFSSPKTPAVVAQTPVPTVDDAAAQQDYLARQRMRKGALSTQLVPDGGGQPMAGLAGMTGSQALLG